MLGNAVAFWPSETSWDAESQSVVFSGDFDGAAPVGSYFVGGGGVFTPDDDFLRGLGAAGDVLRDCVAATGARDLMVAYPTLTLGADPCPTAVRITHHASLMPLGQRPVIGMTAVFAA